MKGGPPPLHRRYSQNCALVSVSSASVSVEIIPSGSPACSNSLARRAARRSMRKLVGTGRYGGETSSGKAALLALSGQIKAGETRLALPAFIISTAQGEPRELRSANFMAVSPARARAFSAKWCPGGRHLHLAGRYLRARTDTRTNPSDESISAYSAPGQPPGS